MEDRSPKTSLDVLNFMFDSLAEGGIGDQPDIEESLKDVGIDTSDVVAKIKEMIDFKEKEKRLSWRKAAQERRLAVMALLELSADKIPATINGIKDAVQELLASEDFQYSPSFSKLQSLDDEDFKAILVDLMDVEKMEDGAE
jgi:hypothetical protein